MTNRILPVSAPLIYLLLLFLLGPAALMQGNNPLLWMLCVLIVIGVLAWYLTRQMLNDLVVKRVLPDHGQVGRIVTVGYQMTRTSRYLPAFDITVNEDLANMMSDASSAWKRAGLLRHTFHQTRRWDQGHRLEDLRTSRRMGRDRAIASGIAEDPRGARSDDPDR